MRDFCCPLCHNPLTANTQGLACCNRHQFDRAKEGYFNLLPVQHKHSREPGDAKEQLQARRDFLEAGYFLPLQAHLQALMPSSTECLLDVGCGEGYFTRAFAQALPSAQVYGIDIAKAGVRLAAKSAKASGLNQRLHFAVASSFDLPLADESMDLVTRIYAPSRDAELYRVIKPGGQLVIVAPAERHLWHLRERIYRQVRAHEPPPVPEGFELQEQERVQLTLRVETVEMRAALLSMTPFAWRMSAELRDEVLGETFEDSLDFAIFVYNKK